MTRPSADPPPPDMEPDHLGWALWRAAEAWSRLFVRAMALAGYPDMTLARARLFGQLDRRAGGRLVAVAASLGISKQAAAQTLDELVAAGYLARVPDPADGRARLIVFTPAGQSFLASADRVKAAIDAALDREAGPGGKALAARLYALADAIDALSPGPVETGSGHPTG